jgi:hypothetical protein
MSRYLEIGTSNTIDFPTRAEFSKKIDYYDDFVLGGNRDRRAYGMVKATPTMTLSYDVNGFKFLEAVLGTSGGTITPGSTIPAYDYKVLTERGTKSIHSAKVNSWELTVQEGNPVTAVANINGTTIGSAAASSFTPDFNNMPYLPYQCTLKIGGSANTLWSQLSIKIDNALQSIFKTSSIPVDIREAGLSITGKFTASEFYDWANEGSMDIIFPSTTIIIGTAKFTSVPQGVKGYDLPDSAIEFSGYPVGSDSAIKVFNSGTKW